MASSFAAGWDFVSSLMRLKFRSADIWSIVGIALLVIGLLIRLALYFPPAMFQIDSDAVLAGLCAFRIADGQHPLFFPGGTRLSAASCYVTAGYFHFLGPGRVGLALTALTWGALYLTFTLLFLRVTLGRKIACVAFLFALAPAEQFMTVTYAPWGYGEIMASCAATLWLAALWRNKGALWQRICFGFSVGLGMWFSLQTLMIVLPAIAWIALKRRSATIEESLPALLGALVGATPFLVVNFAHGFPSLTQNWASRPAANIAQVSDNFVWVTTYLLPHLLFRSSGWWSETSILMAAYAVVAVGFVIALRREGGSSARPYSLRDLGLLIVLVLTTCVLIFSVSNAGTIRGWTVRYIAPFYAVVPLFCGIGIVTLWRWSRGGAVATVAALLIPNLLLYGLPGSALRADLTSELSDDVRLREVLAQRHIRILYGNYVWAYHLNFDTHERIAAIPFAPAFDYLNYGDALATAPVRWALIGGFDEVLAWAHRVRSHGTMTKDGDLWVFIADHPAADAAQLLAELRTVEQ